MDAEIWNQVNLWFWCWARSRNWHKPSVSLLSKRTRNVYLMLSHFASLHHVAHSQMCKKPSCLARRHNGVSRAASLAATLLVAACYQCYLLQHQWPVQCDKHEALISSYQSNVFHPSVFLSLSLLRSALTAESQCDRFLSEVVKSYRQMATIKFVSVSTSPQLSLALLLSAAPHSHILLGHTEHFIKMVSSYRHTGDPSFLVLCSILGGYPWVIHIFKLCVSG